MWNVSAILLPSVGSRGSNDPFYAFLLVVLGDPEAPVAPRHSPELPKRLQASIFMILGGLFKRTFDDC